MMEKYNLTPISKEIIEKAIETAKKFKHKDLEIEHVIYAFSQFDSTKTSRYLYNNGCDLTKVGDFLKNVYFPSCRSYKDFKEVDSELCLNLILGSAAAIAEKMEEKEIVPDLIFISIISNLSTVSEDVISKLDFDVSEFVEEMNKYFKYDTFSIETEDRPEDENADNSLSKCIEFLNKNYENLNISSLKNDNEIIGREKDIFNLEYSLIRKNKSGILIIGEEGVGKTSLVKHLAYRIITGKCSYKMRNFVIYSVNINSLIAGTKYRGDFEEKMQELIKNSQHPNIILFIDDFHNISGAGSFESGKSDAAEILKPYLDDSKIRVIGAVSFQEYKKHLYPNKSFIRRFECLNIKEPTKTETLDILKGKKQSYENHHNIKIKDSILELIVDLCDNYLSTAFFPDKAIDLLDSACARAMNSKTQRPQNLIDSCDDLINSFNPDEDIDLENLNDEQTHKYALMQSCLEEWTEKCEKSIFYLSEKDIIQVLSDRTGIPDNKFFKNDSQKYLKLEKKIKKRVFGQNEAVDKICNCLLRYKAGLKDREKPIGSFLFLGQTGVGKTYISKVLAEDFFIDKHAFIKFDMSEYSDEASVNKLLGSSPGYIGHENGSLIVDKIMKNPHSVVVFDEIEKSHRKVQQILLQILDEATLTDSLGRKADFKNCIVIVTGNIGLEILNKKNNLGFGKNDSFEEKKSDSLEHLKKTLPLELLNRFDEIIYFNELKDEDYKNIIRKELKNFSEILDLKSKNSTNKIIYSDSVVDYIFSRIKSENKSFGAREVKRIIQKDVLDNISSYIISNDKKKYTVAFSKENKSIKIV